MPKTFSELVALSSKQYGLMTHAQAMSAGVSRTKLSRLVRGKVWEQVRPRVFRRSAKSQTEEQELVALCLWLGEGTLVSGYEHHATRETWEADRQRTTRLAALGWRVFQVTSKQLDEEPADVIQRVREALEHHTVSRERWKQLPFHLAP